MTHRNSVRKWLDGYIQAWKSYDRQMIGDLFSEDAIYYVHPYSPPIEGREAIVAALLKNQDEPGTYDADYAPVAVDNDVAVATGTSRYFESDGKTPKAEFNNIFMLRFDEDGRCREYREWYMKTPQKEVK